MKRPFGKRFMSAVLSTVFAFTSAMIVMPPPIHAEEDNYLYTDDGFAYIVNDEGTITLKGRDPERKDEYDETRIVLPSKIDGKYVTEIDTNYFGHSTYGSNSTVTEIVLPDHIEKINNWCFNDYKTLDTLVIPATLKKAERPFTYCKINKVIIEDGMKTVPKSLFSCTDYMGELVIPDSVTAIGDNAFDSIIGLKEIHVPDSVRSIGYCGIANNPDLEVLDLPDTLDFIDTWAFTNNPKLTSVYVPDTWTFGEEKYGFFSRCGIKEISFGPDRTEIPPNICQYCVNLENINWPDAPVKIGSRAFEECYALKDPKIPDSVEIVDSYAFEYCTGIEKLNLPANLKELNARSFGNLKSLKYLYVPMELPTKGNYKEVSAFWQSGIEKLEFAEGITEINAMTASGHPNLTEIVIPKSVTTIRSYAFDGDESLSNINLHEGITTIEGQSVFSGCKSLKELTVPSTLKGDGYAFSSAPALETVYIADGRTEIPEKLFINCEVLKKAVIPESVTRIKANAFARCYELETVEMKQDNVEVENSAFSYCNNLWDERFSIAKKGDLFITKSSPSNARDGITNYTIYYSVNPRFIDNFEKAQLDVSVQPWKHLVIDESLPDGLKAGDVGFRVDLGSPTGIFRFSIRNPEDNTVKVNAEFGTRIHKEPFYEWDVKQIVATDTIFEPVTINVPDTVSVKDGKSSFYVYGYATVGEKVSIMVNDEESTTVDTNEYTGKYSAQVECEPVDGIITVQAVCGSNKSDKVQISVDEDMPVLVDFEVSHETHGDVWHRNMTDMFRTGYSPYVVYNPYHPFDFEVELDNDDNVDRAYVFSDSNGDLSCVPLDKDAETGKYKGRGSFDTTLPGDLYIGQTPKTEKGTAVLSKNADGSSSLDFKGKDLLNVTPENVDPVKILVDNSKIDVSENTSTRTAVRIKMPIPPGVIPDTGPYEEPPSELNINIIQDLSDSIFIDGSELTAEKAAADPEEYGFTESGVTVTDENGDTHVYYTRYLTEESEVREVTEKMAMSDGSSAYSFLKSSDAGTPTGIVTIDKNQDNGETSYVKEFFNETKDLQKDSLAGVDVSLATDLLKGGVKTAAQGATVVMSAVQNGIDLYGSYQGYSNTLEQIDFSKNPDVRAHSMELKAQAKGIYYSRVIIAVGAVTLGAAVTFASAIPCAVGIAIGGVITFGSWLLNKLLDKQEDNLKKRVFASGKGGMKVGIDPSGYVYAAVPDNRVEGATATIYYDDGSGKAVKWNAEDYDQINPQITDSAGWFMWDVPEGLWQVRIEAEGYETYTTEWLPVLPVQTDVNIPLKSKEAARIENIDAYANGVQIKMSQFITDSTAVEENVYLTDSNGDVIPSKIRFSKSENNDTGFSDVITLISDREDISGAELHIASGLLSYSGIPSEASDNKIGKVKDSLIVDTEPDVVMGDVNRDGEINAVDASSVLAYYAMTSTNQDGGYDEDQKTAADVNHDGDINAVDASNILAYYAYVATTAEGEAMTMEEYMKK
ncbi:leucine-rich repeat protein [uncultured Ruminococcus sp.]|uniref:leucine-rich repeat protein n=1 Tax=uncultured Ruminococcus sp. TaxID=165186 RepID=UPI00263817FA|nr:leucine-rich repeat protein [uncultured Ruminococcus sp.]